MKKISIKKQGIETHGAQMEDPTSWIAQEVANNSWGKPDRWLPDSPMSPLSDEEKAKAKESRKVIVKEAKPESIVQVQKELEDGSIVTEDVVTPAQEEESYMEYFFPAEYTIEIEDITAQVEAEKAKKEAKKLAKEKRKKDRKAVDWSKVNTVAELKAIVKSLVEEIDEE